MGSATFALKKYAIAGAVKFVMGDVTMSNSYAAGGDTLTAGTIGLNEVWDGDVKGLPLAIALDYDIANGKMKAYFPTGGAATAPTTLVDPLTASGASTASAVDATRPNLTPGRAKEVAAGADLSSVVGRITFIGV